MAVVEILQYIVANDQVAGMARGIVRHRALGPPKTRAQILARLETRVARSRQYLRKRFAQQSHAATGVENGAHRHAGLGEYGGDQPRARTHFAGGDNARSRIDVELAEIRGPENRVGLA